MSYVPELGQMMFGREWHELEPPGFVEYWLCILEDIVSGTDGWYDVDNEVFSMHPYWWGDEDDPRANRPNFKCGDVEVSWYKHIGRSMSTNTKMPDNEWHKIFTKCVQKAIEDEEKNSEDSV